MDNALRTAQSIIETNIPDIYAGKKLFQYVKHVTGKQKSSLSDYCIDKVDNHYGKESFVISGKRGFIRVTVEPLFKIIGE